MPSATLNQCLRLVTAGPDPRPSPRLDGKTALVTGAASRIGLAIVEEFVAEGADVAALDIDEVGLTALEDRFGESVLTIRCDVTDESAVEHAVAATVNRWEDLDVVVANAGRGTFSPIVDHPLDEWRAILDLCLTVAFLTIKHGGRAMRDGGASTKRYPDLPGAIARLGA